MALPSISTLTLNPAIDRTIIIPGFRPGAVNRAEAAYDRPGGKGINVAAMLASQGQTVAAFGFLGRDNDATFRTFFAEKGIEDRCLRLPGRTRVGIKIHDPSRDETTDINFPGLAPAAADLAALKGRLPESTGGWCVLAGSVPPSVPSGIYRELIGALRERGVRTVLDTSGEALREGVAAAPDIVKPNIHELEALFGRALAEEAEVIAAARELLATGIKTVVVSRGAEGAVFVTGERAVVARPPSVRVGSTVGAGDAMVAGIVAAKLLRLPVDALARLATAFAVAALTRGEADEVTPARVQEFVGRVVVEERT